MQVSIDVSLYPLNEKFNPEEYWSIKGIFSLDDSDKFEGRLIKYNNEKIEKLSIKNEKSAKEKLDFIEKSSFYVNKIEKRETKRNPYPAFTTSSLQIEANRKLGFSANQTMRTAQKLCLLTLLITPTTGKVTLLNIKLTCCQFWLGRL